VYTNQRLNLPKLWEGLRKICQGFKPDSGNLTVRDYRGASENVRHGETVNPPAIERAGTETPHLQRGASDFYPSGVGHCSWTWANWFAGRSPHVQRKAAAFRAMARAG
jgi:hypothetical protein